MWEQMLHDESCDPDEAAATAVLDLEKAFEHVSAYAMWSCCAAQAFPAQLACLMISVYTVERVMTLNGIAAQQRTATFSAVVAGSVGGARALKLVILAVLDALVRR